MRKELRYLIYANLSLLAVVLYITFDFLALVVDDTVEDAFLPTELDSYNNNTGDAIIPKIIHQTYKTTDIPEHWKEGQQSCIDLHPDYKYILWTDEMALEFIKEEYPWFLRTFQNYKYPIQRADAIRYFILSHYGGVYLDLDDGCQKRLDPLLTVPAFVRKTSPTGVSNDVMGSVPRHPLFLKAIKSLENYNRNWLVPYVTIMASTGPLFISFIWKQYKRWGVPPHGIVKILQPNDYKGTEHSFFKISKGSSWHMDDAVFVKSLASHILSCVVAGFVFAFFLLYFEYAIYRALCNVTDAPNANNMATPICSSQSASSSYAKKLKRLRKDSNLPSRINWEIVSDLEKNDLTV